MIPSTSMKLSQTETYDLINIEINSLQFFGADTMQNSCFSINVSYMEKILAYQRIDPSSIVKGVFENAQITGYYRFDPSDHEYVCEMADHPLIVRIQPTTNEDESLQIPRKSRSHTKLVPPPLGRPDDVSYTRSTFIAGSTEMDLMDASSCYIDMLPFLKGDTDQMYIEKRLQPLYELSSLTKKSWDNLPLLCMELSIDRHPYNIQHHKCFFTSNYMKVCLIGLFNMPLPYGELFSNIAATKAVVTSAEHTKLVLFNHGTSLPKHFDYTNFYPQWETVRINDNVTAGCDEKLIIDPKNIINKDGIDLELYLSKPDSDYSLVWRSFHRTLFTSDKWFKKQIVKYRWPFEVHTYGEYGGAAMVTYIDLSQLLYPGVREVTLAVPLHWSDAITMREQCGVDFLLQAQSSRRSGTRTKKAVSPTSTITTELGNAFGPTGADGNDAFIIINVQLERPLLEAYLPPLIPNNDLNTMLKYMEKLQYDRQCTARGQLEDNWHDIVITAVKALKKLPNYGTLDFCTFVRQFSDSRTKLEIATSLCDEAAVYVQNQFLPHNFFQCDGTYEELLMISHACLMKSTCDLLKEDKEDKNLFTTIRAARHARQMQDLPHAVEIYTQAVVEQKKNADYWRELGVCLKEVDRDLAMVCLYQSLLINPRHPLTLMAVGSTIFEEDPESCETFFLAILSQYPLWTTSWLVAVAYYIERQKFTFADELRELAKEVIDPKYIEDVTFSRTWEQELGEWWDHTPILPGMSEFYDAADLLLRFRAMDLAEVCLARALSEKGETPSYFHLVALSHRLRGDYSEAICHIQTAMSKFGEISYLRTLEAECLHKLNKIELAMSSFEKSGDCSSPYSLLLSIPSLERLRRRPVIVDLIRRQPSAYIWIALAQEWLDNSSFNDVSAPILDPPTAAVYASECAVQALKYDKRAGRAWDLLAALVQPESRRQHCIHMALLCRFYVPEEQTPEQKTVPNRSMSYKLGHLLKKCQCGLCHHIRVN